MPFDKKSIIEYLESIDEKSWIWNALAQWLGLEE